MLAAGYEGSQSRLVKILERLTMQREREVPPEYLYYGIPSPWLQVSGGLIGVEKGKGSPHPGCRVVGGCEMEGAVHVYG
jgi:hypothetical protein